VIAIRTEDAKQNQLTTISEAAMKPPGWDFASSSDFMARTDGNTAFQSTYLVQPELTVLKDDKAGFPPAEMCIMTRGEVAAAHPELAPALKELAPRLNVEVSRKLNAEVDLRHRSPKDVAAAFLAGRLP
jgi:glycine betaine/choline ABC-type transport system substrate-binding protein